MVTNLLGHHLFHLPCSFHCLLCIVPITLIFSERAQVVPEVCGRACLACSGVSWIKIEPCDYTGTQLCLWSRPLAPGPATSISFHPQKEENESMCQKGSLGHHSTCSCVSDSFSNENVLIALWNQSRTPNPVARDHLTPRVMTLGEKIDGPWLPS